MYGRKNTSYKRKRASSSAAPNRKNKRGKYGNSNLQNRYAGGAYKNVLTIKGSQCLPQQLRTQFMITGKANIVITAGAAAAFTFSGNSLNDPFAAFGAAKPQMFRELTTFYDRYEVLYSTCKVTFSSGSNDDESDCYIAAVQDTASAYSFATAQLIPGMKYTVLGNNNSQTNKTLICGRNSASIYGFTPGADVLAAQASANPSAAWTWRVGGSPTNFASINTYTISCTIWLTYYTLLSAPKYVAIT